MALLLSRQPLTLTRLSAFKSEMVALDPQTDVITLRLARPTTLNPRAWGSSDRLRVSLVVTVDGVEHRCTGQASGGVRTRAAVEQGEYILSYQPTWGWFGARTGRTRRLGETRQSTYTAHVEIELLAGVLVETEIEVTSTESPAPDRPFHSSVAFDAATSAIEFTGDGTLSLTHTSTGSDRAVFAGVGATGGASMSVTYGGAGMTELWDLSAPNTFTGAGNRLAGQATGAQTVTSTVAGDSGNHALGVISMTGVDQTTPVGAVVTTSGNAFSASVTVLSVGTDDMVVDSIASGWGEHTPGADQTERYARGAGFLEIAGDTQPGSAGGVMSHSTDGGSPNFFSDDFILGAVAFKAAAGGIVEADGSSSGTSTLTGVGASVFAGVSAAAGLAVATSLAAALFAGVLASSGLAIVTGQAASISAALGSSAGVGAATSSAAGLAGTVGASAGSAAVDGQGTNGAESGGDGAAVGTATVTGVGASLATTVGTAAGAATVTGASASLTASVANAEAVATVDGQGSTAGGDSEGNASGTATVAGTGASLGTAAGISAGTATVSAVSSAVAQVVASAQGTATVQADSQGAGVPSLGSIVNARTRSLQAENQTRSLQPDNTTREIEVTA